MKELKNKMTREHKDLQQQETVLVAELEEVMFKQEMAASVARMLEAYTEIKGKDEKQEAKSTALTGFAKEYEKNFVLKAPSNDA